MTRGGLLAALAVGAATAAAPAAGQEAGPLQSFKDWVVGCDNVRSCVALGLSPQGEDNAYLKISRGTVGADEPTVSFSVLPDAAPAAPSLSLALDGAPVAGVPLLQGAANGSYVTAALPAGKARAFVTALKQAKTLTLTLNDAGKASGSFNVSLAGSAAGLLFMDDRQGRVGGVTALIKSGAAPAGAVPAAPRAPEIKGVAMALVDQPGRLPAGVAKATEDDCQDADPVAVRLSGGRTLWGVCSYQAAYNFGFRMWIAGPKGAALGAFVAPGETPDDPAELTNPYLSDDRLTLNALAKGRGLGDCGEATAWAWDGSTFRLARLARFEDCRGVPPDDWPALYRADVVAAD